MYEASLGLPYQKWGRYFTEFQKAISTKRVVNSGDVLVNKTKMHFTKTCFVY